MRKPYQAIEARPGHWEVIEIYGKRETLVVNLPTKNQAVIRCHVLQSQADRTLEAYRSAGGR